MYARKKCAVTIKSFSILNKIYIITTTRFIFDFVREHFFVHHYLTVAVVSNWFHACFDFPSSFLERNSKLSRNCKITDKTDGIFVTEKINQNGH